MLVTYRCLVATQAMSFGLMVAVLNQVWWMLVDGQLWVLCGLCWQWNCQFVQSVPWLGTGTHLTPDGADAQLDFP